MTIEQTDTHPASNAESTAPVPMRRFRWKLALALAIPIVVGSCLGVRALQPLADRTLAEHSALQLDLSRPDALIESASLVSLPKDLLSAPLLHDTLTEDFVFYYEGNADRLGVTGALRRIAYEHELGWRDDLIHDLLDQPAEVALWRGDDGKLKYALMVLGRGALAKVLQPLAEVAASDTQLTQVGELHVDGSAAAVYRLRYNFDRSVLLIPYEDQLLVLSSAAMLQEDDNAEANLGGPQTEQLEALLAEGSPFAARFGLGKRHVRQRITLSADYLALGYGQFIPTLAGVRMELGRKGWQGYLALNPSAAGAAPALAFTPLWQAMPMGASACAAVPLSSEALQPLFERLSGAELLPPELAARLGGPLALCWYGKSRLHTPLVVAGLVAGDDAALEAQLGQVFEHMIGAYEENHADGRFPVTVANRGEATTWQRVVGSSHGLHAAAELPDNEQLSNDHYFNVTLARRGDTLLFSLDDALVTQALATLEQRFPPLAEQLPAHTEVPLYLAADSLAALLETETLSSLPDEVEPVFHNAAQSQLLPKLHALAKHKRYALALPAKVQAKQAWTWVPLTWTEL